MNFSKNKEILKKWNSVQSEVPEEQIEQSWEKFQMKLAKKERKGLSRNYMWAGIAASVLVLLFSTYFFVEIYNPIVSVENLSQLDKQVKLPDGSLVLLKKGSSISYKEEFRNIRGVKLRGQAYFDVIKDSRQEFKVETENTTTRVLGTTFTVAEKEGTQDVKISLYTGRITVTAKDNTELWAIIPGERFIYSKGKGIIEKFNTELSFDQGKEFLDLKGVELEKLLVFLGERFHFRFKNIANIKDKKVTLRINKTDSLARVLKILSTINSTTYEIDLKRKEITVR